jgi:hypothetical protein
MSTEIFFCKEYDLASMKLPGTLIYGPITVPNSYHRIYGTGNGNPVVFARFSLGKEPENLIRCTVANVHSIHKEATR